MTTKFDDIRPYYDSEIHDAMIRIADSSFFNPISRFIFPDTDPEIIRQKLLGYYTIQEFQGEIMSALNERVIKDTIRNFTYSGIGYLDPHQSYLFISNHRDIMLDSSLLQQIFHINGIRTTEISFGNNLMSSPLAIDIGKSNKMYTVLRGGKMKDFYANSLHLSEYIRYAITEKHESIWIAQRNGRTKDGKDATDQGVIKMFCMSEDCNLVSSLNKLNIVPVAVSYQIEPCIVGKTNEILHTKSGVKYTKAPGEDMRSILTGITDYKGDVNISIAEPLREEELAPLAYGTSNEFYKGVCSLIDRRIHKNFRIFCNSYIASDILLGTNTFSTYYTPQEKEEFIQRFHSDISKIPGDPKAISTIYLSIYANPIITS